MSASPTKRLLFTKSVNRIFSDSYHIIQSYFNSTVLSTLTCQSYPTRTPRLVPISNVMFHANTLSPILHANSPTPHLHSPHRSYPFSCCGRGKVRCRFTLSFPRYLLQIYLLITFSIFQETDQVLVSNYYKMHCARE
jgi:hypothetical protein